MYRRYVQTIALNPCITSQCGVVCTELHRRIGVDCAKDAPTVYAWLTYSRSHVRSSRCAIRASCTSCPSKQYRVMLSSYEWSRSGVGESQIRSPTRLCSPLTEPALARGPDKNRSPAPRTPGEYAGRMYDPHARCSRMARRRNRSASSCSPRGNPATSSGTFTLRNISQRPSVAIILTCVSALLVQVYHTLNVAR